MITELQYKILCMIKTDYVNIQNITDTLGISENEISQHIGDLEFDKLVESKFVPSYSENLFLMANAEGISSLEEFERSAKTLENSTEYNSIAEKANEVAIEANKIAKDANKKSAISNVLSLLSLFASIAAIIISIVVKTS